MTSEQHAIIFFDGVCGLCNHTVDWLLQHDLDHALKFAPLQGEAARQILFGGKTPARLESMVLRLRGQTLHKSDAVLAAVAELGGGWRFVAWLRWIPRFIRDSVYDLVAANRYQLFGRRDVCRIPTPEEREYFLN